MGRTGRKRQGRIAVILCKGREERTYNQSQCNKRSVYRAILGGQTDLRLHQQSPRMVPDGIDPVVHKMFITQGAYDVKDAAAPRDRRSSAAHRRSSVFFGAEDAMKDDWLLTNGEYEAWDRAYRLKESDGTADVVLPKTHFELFRDSDVITEPVPENVRTLSLSEWSLWQNRPFPTDSVDHSHRCRNFIAVMELIEQMRLEENGCKYDEEMKALLEEDEVQPLRKGTKDSRACPAASSKAKKKSPVVNNTKTCKNAALFSPFEPDEDFRSTLKVSRSTRSLSAESLHANSVVNVSEVEEEAGAAEAHLDHDVADEMEIEENEESSKNPTNLEDVSAADCCTTKYDHHDEDPTPLPSDLFFTPPPCDSHDVALEVANDCIHEVRQILLRVKKFLTSSPPPLTKLDSLVTVEIPPGSSTAEIPSVPRKTSEQPPLPLQGFLSPLSQAEHEPGPTDISGEGSQLRTHQPQNNGDHVETGDTNGVVDEGSLHDPPWDDLFDSEAQDIYVVHVESPPASGYVLEEHEEGFTNNSESFGTSTRRDSPIRKSEDHHVYIENNCPLIPDQNNTKSDDTDIDVPRAPSPSQSEKIECPPALREERNSFPDNLDDSFDLFEDEEFAEIDQFTSSKAGATDKTRNGGTSVNFNLFDPSLLSEDPEEHEPEDPAASNSTQNTKHKEEVDFDGSQELFSVNFDLGFSIESDSPESEDDGQPANEGEEGASPFKVPSPPNKMVTRAGIMSTPVTSTYQAMSDRRLPLLSPLHPLKDRFSQTPENSHCASTFLKSPTEKLDRTRTSSQTSAHLCTPTKKDGRRAESSPPTRGARVDPAITIGSSPESEDDVVFRRKRKLTGTDVLRSPETPSSERDFDSPMPAVKKRRHVRNTLDSDDDNHPPTYHKGNAQNGRKQEESRAPRHKKKHAARHFLDDEAELSEEEAEFVSSDENSDSEDEADTSLVGFLNDNTQLSQALNDSEMLGVYLGSVRSPAVGNRFKLVHRRHSMAVFSQIPEQDESYMEDSFCVEENDEEEEGASSEEEEEVQPDFGLLCEDSFVGGRKQYRTRRRLKLKDAESTGGQPVKKKRRIIVHDDSSEEETPKAAVRSPQRTSSKPPPDGATVTDKRNAPEVAQRERRRVRLSLQASLSEELDFQPEVASSSTEKPGDRSEEPGASWRASLSGSALMKAPASTASCILADCREISSGPEVITYLRTSHGVTVDICSLGGCDYIVSNRLAVERKSQSEFASSANRSKLVERIQHLQRMFERVCLIVEKDRVKPGETSRLFQRTRYYDGTLSALIGAGVQVLFSLGQEETAGLLKKLMSLEKRKNAGITVPTQVSGHQHEALHFYLSIPSVSYITALNLCHGFPSVRRMANSSVEEIVSKGNVSKQKAEEIYRYLKYVFDPQMVPPSDRRKQST